LKRNRCLPNHTAHGFAKILTEVEVNHYKSKWHSFYSGHLEESVHAIFGHVERIIVGTLVVSAGSHVSTNEPAIMLFGYLRHGLVGRGVVLFGVILLALNFLDGLYRLSKSQWHTVLQMIMAICYVALSVRLVQLILAFRGE
jgi:type IV secretory pathway VirB2 component (pilin)